MRVLFLVEVTFLMAFFPSSLPSTAEISGHFRLSASPQDSTWNGIFWHVNSSVSPGKNRVVFMGDSITFGWTSEPFFSQHPEFIGRGLGGQTTQQMLARFETDVISLKPAVVHIMGGTNDIAGNTGPETDAAIEDAISSMIDLAVANNITVILGSIPPTKKFGWRPELQPAQRIKSLNAWLKEYAASLHITFVDYWTAMAAPDGGMNPQFTSDGVHPNPAGYSVMGSLFEDALRQVEGK